MARWSQALRGGWTMMGRLRTYWRVWKIQALNALQQTFINRGTNALFMMGKAIRFAMMLLVLLTIRSKLTSFAGYTADEMVLFFLIYQFIDTFSQVLYRGVYSFQPKIRNGEFDFLLLQPISPLFQSLISRPDINDAVFIFPTTAISVYIASQMHVTITITSFLLFLILLINSFLIVSALHIIVLVFGILTMEVDGVIWLYRDLNRFGQFPITIYREPIRTALFFVVPIGMMLTVPTEVLLNIEPTHSVIIATIIGVGFFTFSLWLWNWALKHYSSASS